MKTESNKTNRPGRPKGSRNKVHTSARKFIQEILDENADQIKQDFVTLSPSERIRLVFGIIPYLGVNVDSNIK